MKKHAGSEPSSTIIIMPSPIKPPSVHASDSVIRIALGMTYQAVMTRALIVALPQPLLIFEVDDIQ
jgi:hypothetical protein